MTKTKSNFVTKATAYLTKDCTGAIELWKSQPKFDRENQIWNSSIKEEVGTEITDDNFLSDMMKENECIEITITKIKSVYDYNNSPEGKLLNAIFNK